MEKQKNIDSNISSKKKPKWLRTLESQSWQAELIVSGLAIFGSLQLPEILHNLVDFCLYNLSEEYMNIVFYLFIYPYYAAVLLIISFIVHLILRGLWIGMLGLASVFPNGINMKQEFFSQDYMEKFMKKYPDVNQFNKQLDNLCSSIFASTAAMSMVMVMISVSIFLILLLATMVNWLIPSISLFSTFTVVGGTFFAFSLFSSILNLKYFREKNWVKKIQFPMAQTFGHMIYLVAMKPMSYISMIFMTNTKMKNFFAANIAIFLISPFFLFPILKESNMAFFLQSHYFQYQSDPNHLTARKYENLFPEDFIILAPVIPSDIIEGSNIRLFIPWLEREQKFADDLCGKFIEEEDLSRIENRLAKSKHKIECSQKYFEIYLNDSLLTDLKYYQHFHSNDKERGFLTYIPTKNCKPLENILKIKSHYKNEEGEMKETQIPFIFEGK